MDPSSNAPLKQVALPSHTLPPPRSDAPPGKRSVWPWAVVVLLLLAAAGAGYWYYAHHKKEAATAAGARKSQQDRTIPVAAATARAGDLPLYIDGLGSATAFNTVTVRSRVDGQLVRVAYAEGQAVKEGDLLAEIDPRPFQATVAQAEGQLAKDQAQLHNAQLDLQRYQNARATVTQQQLDTQAANVKQFEGVVQADQAMVDNAKLQLSYCRITAPIGGRAGLRLVDVGNMVHANDANGLVVITQLQPISVVFTVPQDSISRVMQKQAAGQGLTVDAFSRDLQTKIATGTLQAIDNQVDPSTGTVRLKATFENKDNALFPNQFVNARLLIDTLHDVLIVPAAGVQHGPDSTFAYVVRSDDTVEMRPITVGASQGEQTVVTAGLTAGERVVTDGVDKLQQGSKVTLARPGATTAATRGASTRHAATGPASPDHADAGGTASPPTGGAANPPRRRNRAE